MPGPRRTRRPSVSAYAARPWLASYPAGVPAEVDAPRVPLTRLLDDAAASFPQRTALAFLGTTMTYRELQEAVDRFATGLRGLGVGKGDRVALVLPNCPQNVIATYAALRLGAVVVQHNPLYTEAELRHQLVDSGAVVVVCLDRNYAAVAAVRADTALRSVVVTSLADYLPTGARLRLRLPVAKAKRARAQLTASVPKDAPVEDFRALLRSTTRAQQEELDPDTDLAVLQYTGGTTGTSKGAMLTHTNLVSNAYMNRVWDTEAVAGKEVTLAVLPLFHVFGLSVAMNATLLLAGTLVLLPRFDLDQVFEAIDTFRPTMFPGVPPIYKALADSPKAASHDLRSIRLCVSGAMRLPTEISEHFERISGATLVEGYGLTETSPSTHCNPLDGSRRPGSIGLPLPSTLCRVVSQDDPTVEVPPGEPGELAISGPQVFLGYWGLQEQEGVFTDDGYVLTGDVVVMDPDGYFTVVDRKKELIIAGGFNIYPSEVEAVLMSVPGVAEAVVVGLPDRYRGETVKAYVVVDVGATVTEAELVEHCRTQLTAYKVPKAVEVRESLPRTTVGKVLRRALLEEERLKAEAAAQATPASTPGGRPRPRSAAAQPVTAQPVTAQPVAAQPVAGQPGAAQPGAGQQVAGQQVVEAAVDTAAVASTTTVRTAARKKAVVKAPPTAQPVRPAPTAKAPAKKAPAAKAPAAKAPAAKAPAEKAPAKESAARKSPPLVPVAKASVVRPAAVKPAARKSPPLPKRSS